MISANGAGKSFGSVEAVESIDLDIEHGEIVSIVGPSGSGKTTTIRMILGLYQPSAGSVEVFGIPPDDFTRLEQERIGYLPQQFLLYEDLTVRENLLFAAGMYGLGPRERRERLPRLLEQLDLTDAEDRLARDISGGMQRRVALAATLMHQPDLIILDEPTAGLDPVLRESIWTMFEELRQEGATILVTTQYITETERCDRVLLLNHGELIAQGSPGALRREAYRGEVIRLSVREDAPDLKNSLEDFEVVQEVREIGDQEFELIVESANTAIPFLVDELRSRDIEVEEMREVQVSMDTVFVELVRRASGTGTDAPSP